jgi:hypothetical protein
MLQISCGNKTGSVKVVTQISTKYYIVKDPSPKDEKLLKDYVESGDKKLSSEAKTLLFGYYVKSKQYKKAYDYLNKESSGFSTEGELGTYFSYWRIITDLEMNQKINKDDAIKLLAANDGIKLKNKLCENYPNNSELINNALCEGYVKSEDKLEEESIEKKLIDIPVLSDLKEDSKVLLIGKDDITGFNQGVLFSIKENNLKFEIVENKVDDETIVINTDHKTLKLKDKEISFAIDYSNDTEKIFNYVWNNNPDLVVIAINENYIPEAKDLQERFKFVGINVIILNYEVPSFRDKLEVIKEEYGDLSINFIAYSDEKSAVKFVPLMKLMSEKPDDVGITIVVDVFDDMYFKEEYRDYFTNVDIFTYIDANMNFWSKKFFNGYKFFYDDVPNADAYLGHDMIIYLKKILVQDSKCKYVSGIEYFENNKPIRKLVGYKIVGRNKIKKIKIE